MKLVLEEIHGNSKVSDMGGWILQGRQITVSPKLYGESRDHFSELFNFFTETLGHSVDIHTLETLNPRPATIWTYQIESKYGNHRFFIKNRADLDWFLLKYSHTLDRWSK